MCEFNLEEEVRERRFDVALATRQFEIDMFWKRSLFFWGFIGAAFIAIATLNGMPVVSLLVAGFGMVCALAWTLVNRGSKYWQEQWESKIEAIEDGVTGPLFRKRERPQDKGWWLSGRAYSVSRLAIAVSDYVFLTWVALFINFSWAALAVEPTIGMRIFGLLLICIVSVGYLGVMARFGRSG